MARFVQQGMPCGTAEAPRWPGHQGKGNKGQTGWTQRRTRSACAGGASSRAAVWAGDGAAGLELAPTMRPWCTCTSRCLHLRPVPARCHDPRESLCSTDGYECICGSVRITVVAVDEREEPGAAGGSYLGHRLLACCAVQPYRPPSFCLHLCLVVLVPPELPPACSTVRYSIAHQHHQYVLVPSGAHRARALSYCGSFSSLCPDSLTF